MNRITWIERCSARLSALTSFSTPSAHSVAADLAREQAELYGASGAAWPAPESAAEQWAVDDREATSIEETETTQ